MAHCYCVDHNSRLSVLDFHAKLSRFFIHLLSMVFLLLFHWGRDDVTSRRRCLTNEIESFEGIHEEKMALMLKKMFRLISISKNFLSLLIKRKSIELFFNYRSKIFDLKYLVGSLSIFLLMVYKVNDDFFEFFSINKQLFVQKVLKKTLKFSELFSSVHNHYFSFLNSNSCSYSIDSCHCQHIFLPECRPKVSQRS